MAQPSKAGAVLLFVFGLPFFGFGLVFALAFLSFFPSLHKNGDPIAGAAFGFAFALIGLGLMIGAVFGYRKAKQDQATKDANPDSPWLWRSDWATGKALSQKRNTIFGWWIGTVISSMIILPIALSTVPGAVRNSDPKALIPLGLCVIPLILLIGALRASIRRERYGTTYFEFAALPFSPGKRVTGQIHLRLDTAAEHGIDLRLACVRTITTGSGKQQSTNSITLWQDQKNVSQGALSVGPLGTAIPVDFGVPQDAYETNHDNYRDQLAWVLYAKADVPGVDYSDAFEVPVFRSGASVQSFASQNFASDFASSSFASSSTAAAAGTAPAFESNSTEVPAPANPKVMVSAAADGSTEFYFPPFRNRMQTLVLLLVTAGWTALVYFLAHSKAPWFFAPAFGLFDLLLVYGCLQSVLGSTTVKVGHGKVTSLRKILGSGTPSEFGFGDIQSVLAAMSVQSSSGTTASYAVRLQTKEGNNKVLADGIADRQEAQWIVSQIEKLAGLKTDTHVVLEGPFGSVYAPPPQRAAAGSMRPSTVRQRNKVSIAIGLSFFAIWVGFIALMFVKNTGVRQHRSQVAIKSGARSSAHKFSPLTDADLNRLQQLPIQGQAEELLERAIGHDERALDLFEQNIQSEVWLGKVKLTPKMKDLERRSEYSSDLRVRYANADLDLSMDGWAKTDESADLLIERAKTDAQYRAASVYFMGMLAGRGVAYDKLYPVLLDYAEHDSDVTVRQWAVEGMRYLGTDQALDQLFEIFTSDPSYQVRDRAGCNISDCGNFKRAQRMRMVPKLLSLVADSRTDSQMRNWGFLALHEITGNNLPSNASAWQNWYEQHAAEKLAQFEKADWWQVNGDE
ncbi:MAG TPA: HEAT repeat domain-containing protein [Terriglobales bacterium]|nr:HEAT repeat domain-containing protein [Terriglobales bacterium]